MSARQRHSVHVLDFTHCAAPRVRSAGTWSRGNPCTWRWAGVECDASGNVVALRLKPSFMSSWGPLNWDALANVTTLRVLELPVRAAADSVLVPAHLCDGAANILLALPAVP